MAQQGFEEGAVRAAYSAWLASGPFDIGSTTRAGIRGTPDERSQSNGSAMRISPLGIFGHSMPADKLAGLARRDSALTHPNRVCCDAAAALAVGIAYAIRTGADGQAVLEFVQDWAEQDGAAPEVSAALRAAAASAPSDFQHQMGWVLIALQNAFY